MAGLEVRDMVYIPMLLAIYLWVIIAGTGILLLLPGGLQRLQQSGMQKRLACLPAALQGIDFVQAVSLGLVAIGVPFIVAYELHAAVFSKYCCLIIVVLDAVVVLPVVLALLPLTVVAVVISVVGCPVLVLASLTRRVISCCAPMGLAGLSKMFAGTRGRKVLITMVFFLTLAVSLCISMAVHHAGMFRGNFGMVWEAWVLLFALNGLSLLLQAVIAAATLPSGRKYGIGTFAEATISAMLPFLSEPYDTHKE